MKTFMQNNRIESESQRLFTILKQARNNAIVTNTPSLVCRSTLAQTSVDGDGIECRTLGIGANDWAMDLMLYSAMSGADDDGPDALYENQQIQSLAAGNADRQAMLKTVSEAPNNDVEVTANQDDYVIRFNPDGSLANDPPYRFGICDDRDNPELYGRYIEINTAGQIRLTRIEPDDPERGCTPT